MLGQEINVFMESIGQNIPEYLVNFDYFVDIMDKYGFVSMTEDRSIIDKNA